MASSISDKLNEIFNSEEGFVTYFLEKLYKISGLKDFNVKTIGVFVLITLVALVIEYILIQDKQKSSLQRIKRGSKSTINDVVSWFITGLGIFNFLGVVFTLGIFYLIDWLVTKDINVFAVSYIKLDWLSFILVFLLTDLKAYWNHRLVHVVRPLWELHAFHHSATEFTVLSAQRGHFVETAVVVLIETLFWKLIGASPINIIYIAMLVQIQQGLVHSNLTENWGFLGKYIFVSPAAHRVHHSIYPRHFNTNFGVVFIFWDRLFRSYAEPEKDIEIGIPDNPYNKKNYVADIWLGYKRFLSETLKLGSRNN